MIRGSFLDTRPTFKFLLIGILASAAFFVIVPSRAQASHCGQVPSASGYLFDSFENVEYINGLLVLHLKLKTPFNDGRGWTLAASFFSDECGGGTSSNPQTVVRVTAGIQLYSIRFVSPTRFEIWNDEENLPVSCDGCALNVPDVPAYYEVKFHGSIGGGNSTFSSGSYKIRENAPEPPVSDKSLPTPPGCPSFQENGTRFDNYEHAEYINGFLVYRFRLVTPENDGSHWYSFVALYDENCVGRAVADTRPSETKVKSWSRYYSVRFSSATHYDIWNDESNTIETCQACSADIPAQLPDGSRPAYVSFRGAYDNQSFTSTPHPVEEPKVALDPVIIVPGILGSWKRTNGEWQLDPILHIYDNLYEALQNAGYKKDKTLFFLGYDFRQDNAVTAGELKNKIENIKSICDCAKVDIVAHSMGGLVARSYIQGDQYANDIDQLIFLGTPHKGSPKSYLAWEGGELGLKNRIFNLRDVILTSLFSGAARHENYSTIYDYIRGHPITGLQQLLPNYEYILEDADSSVRDYPLGYPANSFLDDLNSSESLAKLAASGVKLTNIVGNIPNSTVGGYSVIPSTNPPLWEDGFPNNFYASPISFRGMFFEDGDETVPLKSALAVPGVVSEELTFEHGKLPNEAQSAVIKELTGKDGIRVNRKPFPISAFFIRIFSPISVEVADPQGRTTGVDAATGNELNDIPGAFYTGADNGEQFLVIPDPEEGDYQINVKGTGAGEYAIQASLFGEGLEQTSEVKGNVERGTILGYTASVLSDVTAELEIEPQDSTAPSTTAQVIGTKGKNEWFVSDEVRVSLSAEDNIGGVGAFKTEYSLDNGTTWSDYQSELIFTDGGTSSLLYRSTDFVGNKEAVQALEIKIDRTLPEADIGFDDDAYSLLITGADILSSTTVSRNDLTYIIEDEAGHTLELVFAKNKQSGKTIIAQLKSLRYDNGDVIPAPKNELRYVWSFDKATHLKELNQHTVAAKQFDVRAEYVVKKDETAISIKPFGAKKQSLKNDGMSILRLITDDGRLKFKY